MTSWLTTISFLVYIKHKNMNLLLKDKNTIKIEITVILKVRMIKNLSRMNLRKIDMLISGV
jgi:hypothetical protein